MEDRKGDKRMFYVCTLYTDVYCVCCSQFGCKIRFNLGAEREAETREKVQNVKKEKMLEVLRDVKHFSCLCQPIW